MVSASPEELLQSINEGNESEHVHDLLDNVKAQRAAEEEYKNSIEFTPHPEFAIKTRDSNEHKVFLNVCSSSYIPAPGSWTRGKVPENVQRALESQQELSSEEQECIRFPISCSQPRIDFDSSNVPCTVIDCVLNDDVMGQAKAYRRLKQFVIEIVMAWVQEKLKQTLDPKYKLPKLKYKGDTVQTQRIRADKVPIVREIKELPDEPSFPLVTKPIKNSALLQQGNSQAPINQAYELDVGSDVTQVNDVVGGQDGGNSKALKASSQPQQEVASSKQQTIKYNIQYKGSPVTGAMVTCDIDGNIVREALGVCVSNGRSIQVTYRGNQICCIDTPFFIQTHEVNAVVLKDKLEVWAPVRPVEQVISELQQNRPHKLESLGLQVTDILDM